MKYLALDQSLNTTGWAIFEDYDLVDFGHFNISANKPIEERLMKYSEKISEVFTWHEAVDDEVSYIFFEDIQSQQNLETYKKLAYVQAITIYWCANYYLKYSILGPSHWRRVLKEKYKIDFGKTRLEQKAAAQKFVKDHFDKYCTEDEADAICLGLAGIVEKQKNKSAF